MVIGKRIDHYKEWSLSSAVLKETNECKLYRCIFFLSFSYHINCNLKDNFEEKYNYLIKLFSFNRISFDAALWKYIIRLSIAHGCVVWIP